MNKTAWWLAIGITVLIAGLFTYLGIIGIGTYGIAVFVLTPLLIGMLPVMIYGNRRPVSKKQAMGLGFATLGIYALALLIFAIEGLICVAMAAPIGIPIMWAGTLFGHEVISRPRKGTASIIIILMLSIPITAFVEKNYTNTPELIEVKTSIVIDARPEDVWKNVIEFPQLSEPTEFIFKTGIAYPVNAEIKGHGVGATRYCNFSTGCFVEPITVWSEPELLKFDVAENPAPMKELSFYALNPPHLHGYFVSKQGQFKLTKLEGEKTLLEGTTWYYHEIQPAFYWRLWSEYIIHKIHWRVLGHIKEVSEK